jgi:hypothetical protein
MANAFHSALLERERARQKLAETMENNYASEARKASVLRYLFLAGGVLAALYLLQKAPDRAKVKEVKVAIAAPSVVEQVKQQLQENDQLLISPGNDRQLASTPFGRRAGSYAREHMPVNLYADLVARKKDGQPSALPGFRVASDRERRQALEIALRKELRKPPSAGLYRPGETRDLRKLPLSRPSVAAPAAGQYKPLSSPPPALASDPNFVRQSSL